MHVFIIPRHNTKYEIAPSKEKDKGPMQDNGTDGHWKNRLNL